MSEIEPTKEYKAKISAAKRKLTKKYEKNVTLIGNWCLRFNHRVGSFDYWPTTGRWIATRGERGRKFSKNSRYMVSTDVDNLITQLNDRADWVLEQRKLKTTKKTPSTRPSKANGLYSPEIIQE